MLPHPSFVYTCDVSTNSVIATGCYDKTVRIWTRNVNNSQYDLIQELEAHKNYVTSVCFNGSGELLYSSDSAGVVLEWYKDATEWNKKRLKKCLKNICTCYSYFLFYFQDDKFGGFARYRY